MGKGSKIYKAISIIKSAFDGAIEFVLCAKTFSQAVSLGQSWKRAGLFGSGSGSGLSSKKFLGPYAKFFHSRLINIAYSAASCIFKTFGEFKFRA